MIIKQVITLPLSSHPFVQACKKFDQYITHILTNMPVTAADDYTFYSGTTGRAALFLKLWANTKNTTLKANYLKIAQGYIDNAIKTAPIDYKSSLGFFGSFTGTYAVAAVIYSALGDTTSSNKFIQQVQQAMPHGINYTDFSFDTGVAGLMQSGLYLNWYFKKNVITETSINALAEYLIERGVYFGKKYGNGTYLLWDYAAIFGGYKSYGQGHGMFGTLQRLMDTDYVLKNKTVLSMVRSTMDLLVSMQLPSGQFPDPFSLSSSSTFGEHGTFGIEAVAADLYPLVQWCHGAPGAMALYTRAWQVFGDTKYLVAAERAANYTWIRGLLAKGLTPCHGITGNAYMFLILYRATQNERYLWRALKFQEFVLDTPIVSDLNQMRVPTPSPYSVWLGSWAGASLIWGDMLNIAPQQWCVPGFESCL